MKRKTYTAFVIDGPRRSCRCVRDETSKRVVLRAATSDFDVKEDPGTLHLIWKAGKDGRQIVCSLRKSALDYESREGEHIFTLGGAQTEGEHTYENFHGQANSQGDGVNIFKAGQPERAVEPVGDRSAGPMTAARLQKLVEQSPLRRVR